MRLVELSIAMKLACGMPHYTLGPKPPGLSLTVECRCSSLLLYSFFQTNDIAKPLEILTGEDASLLIIV